MAMELGVDGVMLTLIQLLKSMESLYEIQRSNSNMVNSFNAIAL